MTAKVEALEYQRERDEERLSDVETHNRDLASQLVEKEGRAAAAEAQVKLQQRRSRTEQKQGK